MYARANYTVDTKCKSDLDAVAVMAEATRNPMPSGRHYTYGVIPELSHLNRYWFNERWKPEQDGYMPQYMDAIHTLQKERTPDGQKIRKWATGQNAPVLIQACVYEVSPVFFFPEIRDWDQDKIDHSTRFQRGEIDMESVDQWYAAMSKFIEETYGDNLLSYQLHMDENSPHIHVQFVTVTDNGKLSATDYIHGSPGKLNKHRDQIAAAVKHLGISRANSKELGQETKHTGMDPDEWRAHMERVKARDAALEEMRNADMVVHTEVPANLKLPRPVKPEKPGWLAPKEEVEEYQEALAKYNQESDPKWRAKVQREKIIEHLNDEELKKQHLRNQLEQKDTELRRTQKELAALRDKEKKREEAVKLRSIPLQEVMARCYPDIPFWQDPRDKSHWYLGSRNKTEARKLGISEHKFIDEHDHTFKGGGAIDLVMMIEELPVGAAMAKLRDYFSPEELLRHIATQEPQKLLNTITKLQAPPEPTPPPKHEGKSSQLKTWMQFDMHLSYKLVDHLFYTGQVYGDNRANCIIPRPGGGYFGRGTVKLKSGEPNTYKTTKGSKKAGAAKLTGPEYKGKEAILCEGIKDGLALLALHPEAAIYITGGNLHPDIFDDLRGQKILLGFDPDPQGKEHLKYYQNIYPKASSFLPPEGYKDWAEYWEANHPSITPVKKLGVSSNMDQEQK